MWTECLISLLKESCEMNLLSAYVTINQSLLFLPPWVRRQKPSVPAHMPSSEGCTVSSAFQECFRAWWSALSQSPIELEMWPRSSWGFFLDRFIKGESEVRERYFLLMTDTDIDFTSSDCSAQALSHHGRESGVSNLGGNADSRLRWEWS